MTTTATKSTQTMTYEEDKKALNEVIDEMKKEKKSHGSTKIYTTEEALGRRRACDKRRYYADPPKNSIR